MEVLTTLNEGRELTDEILSTRLAEAEDMINTRLLTYIPQDAADEDVITRNHSLSKKPTSVDKQVEGYVDFAETLHSVYKRL